MGAGDRRAHCRNGGVSGLRIDITELKQAQAALRESKARLDRAQSIARIGSWELDLTTGCYQWSKEMYRIRGLPANEFEPSIRESLAIHLPGRPACRPQMGCWPQETRQARAEPNSGLCGRVATCAGSVSKTVSKPASTVGKLRRDHAGHHRMPSSIEQQLRAGAEDGGHRQPYRRYGA